MNNEPTARQNGFSLVEIMIATIILTVGMLAMAASTGYVSALLRSAAFDTGRAAAKQQIVEELRGRKYSGIATNSTGRVIGKYTLTFNIATQSNYKRVQLITSGPAYRANRTGSRTTVVDTMYFDILSP